MLHFNPDAFTATVPISLFSGRAVLTDHPYLDMASSYQCAVIISLVCRLFLFGFFRLIEAFRALAFLAYAKGTGIMV